MGCGCSRVVNDFLDKNQGNYGDPSDFLQAISVVEENNGSKILSLVKVEYSPDSYGLQVLHAQKWTIRAVFDNSRFNSQVYSVWINNKKQTELQFGFFSDE